MLTVAPLPLSDGWTSLQLEPGQWAHYELQVCARQAVMGVVFACTTAWLVAALLTSCRVQASDPPAVGCLCCSLQLPPVTSTPANMELLVSLERTAGDGFGGDPLLFVKPYDALGRNEPTVDAQASTSFSADALLLILRMPGCVHLQQFT